MKSSSLLNRDFRQISANGSRLCAGGDLEHESFNSAQKPIRITAVEFNHSAPLAQNRCYLPFFSVGSSKIYFINNLKYNKKWIIIQW